MVAGMEGGAEVHQHERRHLAFIDGTHKVVVLRQYYCLRRVMEGKIGRLLGWEQVVEGRTNGETFRSNPFNKVGNEWKVRDRLVRAGVVGVYA
jgi:hypothetical protein